MKRLFVLILLLTGCHERVRERSPEVVEKELSGTIRVDVTVNNYKEVTSTVMHSE